MLVNQKTFNIESKITDDWGGSHRVVLDMEALSTAKNWEVGVSLPENYKIDQIYGAQLITRDGKTYISGKDWNQSLNKGQKSEVVLIVDEGISGNAAPIQPELFFANPVNNSTTKNSNSEYDFNFKPTITDDWGGSHRVVLDLEALSTAKDWKAELSLPKDYKVDQIYGGEISYEEGKTYISGKDWNKDLDKGGKAKVVLIVDEGESGNAAPITPQLSFGNSANNSVTKNNNNSDNLTANNMNNKYNFNLESTITDDWGGSHRVVLDLEALSTAKNWKTEISLPQDYKIDQVYGGEVSYEGGKTYISGKDWNKDLGKGEKAKVVLIVDEGKSADAAPITPQLLSGNSVNNSISDNNPGSDNNSNQSDSDNNSKSNSDLSFDSQIVQDWNGGYKLEVDLKANSNVTGWEADFKLPYKVRAAYGVDLIDRGNGNYTISGQNNQVNLQKGQSISPIFIIDDGGKAAVEPKFAPLGGETANPIDNLEPKGKTNTPITDKTNNNNKDIGAQPNDNGKVISVDNDFGGNLGNAIAAADNGDVVQLGGKTYYTSGLTIGKDITLDGQKGTIINGGGTNNPIINITQNADGATIQDIQITNGNVGINASGASNLTLQNLDVNNIGISQVMREGQNNIGINLGHAEGLMLRDSKIHNIGRKGMSIGDTDGATVSNITVHNVNLDAQHSQSHDAAGIKFFNTNDILLKDSTFSKINANNIWNDTTNATTIEGNTVIDAGDSFREPSFNSNVNISGIYNEKSSNSIVRNNKATSLGGRFDAFTATKFTTETQTMYNNDFSSMTLGSTDYWVNESAEKLIAITENPDEANFNLFAEEYWNQANLG